MPFYFIQKQDVLKGHVLIGLPLSHHLIQVLRYQKGDSLTLVDEERHKYTARILSVSSNSIESEVLSKIQPSPQKKPLLHLGIALLKGDKMDWAIQKAAELGVDRISPLITRRVVAKLPASSQGASPRQKRWFEIAKEAAQQSERLEIPIINIPLSLELFLGERPLREETQSADMKYIFWEKAPHLHISTQIHASLVKSPERGIILIGPEGGFEKEEVDQAIEKGYIAVSLGERPVRAETAALMAITILQYEMSR